jgi:hypothetical protein
MPFAETGEEDVQLLMHESVDEVFTSALVLRNIDAEEASVRVHLAKLFEPGVHDPTPAHRGTTVTSIRGRSLS